MYALARITQRAGREGEEQNRFSNNGYFYTLSPLRGVGVADGFICNGTCSYDVYSVAWSPDGKLLASGSADETVRVWSAEDGSCAKVLSGHRYVTATIPCMYQP